mgnify:CR=1 FL=1
MTHSIYTVKRDLPNVKIKIGNKIVTGQVRGRMEHFATIWSGEANYEFAWQTIANALNNDKPLLT